VYPVLRNSEIEFSVITCVCVCVYIYIHARARARTCVEQCAMANAHYAIREFVSRLRAETYFAWSLLTSRSRCTRTGACARSRTHSRVYSATQGVNGKRARGLLCIFQVLPRIRDRERVPDAVNTARGAERLARSLDTLNQSIDGKNSFHGGGRGCTLIVHGATQRADGARVQFDLIGLNHLYRRMIFVRGRSFDYLSARSAVSISAINHEWRIESA